MSDNSGLVSVVVPVYNKADYIRETLQSVVGQSYPSIEIIVVNSGSTDSSPQVIAEFAREQSFRPIKVLTVENRGPSAARNVGLKAASGRYLMSLDGDDCLAPDYVAKGFSAMKQLGVEIVCSDVEFFGAEQGQWIPDAYDPYFIRYNNSIPTAAVYVRELFEKTGGYREDLPFVEDWEFWINCTRHTQRVFKISERLFRYRRSTDGLYGSYVEGEVDGTMSLVMLANPELYNIEDLRFAQDKLVLNRSRAEPRVRQYIEWFPTSWLMPFVLGIFEESQGKNEAAMQLYFQAAQNSNFKNFLALYRIALLCKQAGNLEQARNLMHEVRILRPDMSFVVSSQINQLETAITGMPNIPARS